MSNVNIRNNCNNAKSYALIETVIPSAIIGTDREHSIIQLNCL